MNWKRIYDAQVDESDCGVAALSMLMKFHRSKIPLAQLREYAKTTTEGTSIYGIKKAAEEYNLECKAVKFEKDIKLFNQEFQNKLPMIVHVLKEKSLLHYYVILEINGKNVKIADPDKNIGIIDMPVEKFLKEWDGVAIICKPNKKYNVINIKQRGLYSYGNMIINDKKLLFMIFFSAIIMTVIQILSAFLFQGIIDNILPNNNKNLLEIVSIGLIIGYFFENISLFFNQYLTSYLGQKLSKKIIIQYLNHIFYLPVSFFKTRKRGDILSRFNDSGKIVDVIAKSYVETTIDIIMVIVVTIVLFKQNYILALVACSILPVYACLILFFIKPFEKQNEEYMKNNSKISSTIVDTLSGIEVIKAMNWEEAGIDKIIKEYDELLQSSLKFSKMTSLQKSLIVCIDSILSLVILWIGAELVINGKFLLGQLITFNTLAIYLTNPIQNIVQLQSKIHSARIAINRLNEVYAVEKEVFNINKNEKYDLEENIISIENMDVDYNFTKKVLSGVNFSIQRGEKIALVGESGSGKSTLVRCLVKLQDISNGDIIINKESITSISVSKLRKFIKYVPQTPMIFSETLLYNLIGSNNLNGLNLEKIDDIFKITGVDKIIRELPQGIFTILEENGSNLSGGQKQRICLARSLISNPAILILDEATNGLDEKSEIELLEKILNLNLTVIAISHRIKLINKFDKVIKLENGGIQNI